MQYSSYFPHSSVAGQAYDVPIFQVGAGGWLVFERAGSLLESVRILGWFDVLNCFDDSDPVQG